MYPLPIIRLAKAYRGPRFSVSIVSWIALVFLGALLLSPLAQAEDGYQLWLRYPQVQNSAKLNQYKSAIRQVVLQENSDTGTAIRDELTQALPGLLGIPVPFSGNLAEGSLLIGTPGGSPIIKALGWDADIAAAGSEGFLVRSTAIQGKPVIVIASQGKTGLLYGTFRLLETLQTEGDLTGLNLSEKPRMQIRILNHWDNIDGSIERGYAGPSIWRWKELPAVVSPRYRDYARANASVGINGAVLNNVNPQPEQLTEEYLKKAAVIAGVLRPYGMKIYISILFDSPKRLGGLPTFDPLDPAVREWWKRKADEIYSIIPDFGGFLVKADSEGRPGPSKYHRTHAEGANVIADALAPHGGFLMWRCFVYETGGADRARKSYDFFHPLDGKFHDNVFLQVKYGPIDFQPREMFHPLFGSMPKTRLGVELQITQENTGHSTHLVYLGPLWREFFSTDTAANGPGTTIERIVEGYRGGTCIAGVSNVGSDRNWTGHNFAQANWYAYGRFAWNPATDPAQSAEEWIRMTWSNDPAVVHTLKQMMMGSREAMVDYEMPIGLTHIMEGGDHYGPNPGEFPSMHKAGQDGIGFDRSGTGSKAVDQYARAVGNRYNNRATCPDELLLWFHHVPWDYKMHSGRTVWDELCYRYNAGVEYVKAMQTQWESVRGKVDDERFEAVESKLSKQVRDSTVWRDTCIRYFHSVSGQPLPDYLSSPVQ